MGKERRETVEKKSFLPGLILILIGSWLMLDTLNIVQFSFQYLVLLIGLIFLLAYLTTKNYAFIIPGAILTCMGIIILLNIAYLPYLWTLIVSIAFFSVYLAKREASWAMIVGLILLAISLMIIVEYYTSIDALPLILIALGFYLIYKNYRKAKK